MRKGRLDVGDAFPKQEVDLARPLAAMVLAPIQEDAAAGHGGHNATHASTRPLGKRCLTALGFLVEEARPSIASPHGEDVAGGCAGGLLAFRIRRLQTSIQNTLR